VTGGVVPQRVVVLVGTDAAALGEAARELEGAETRAAVFVGDVTDPAGRAALREFVAELFPT
jgi:NAD(P)-dependent dehydrogenase (short-subunit alcohol dehydrogenase family)